MADEWHWSEWITPSLVQAKADVGTGNAGAGVSIGDDSDPNHAVDAVRLEGAANQGSSLNPDAPPYSYTSSHYNGDAFSTAFTARGYDRAGAVLSDPPTSYASFNVGYAGGYWRERPTLRQLPPEFLALTPSEYVKIDPAVDTWDGYVEFEPGVDTVGVRWGDIWVNVLANGGLGNDLAGSIGYAPSALLPPTSGWSGSFGSWPPPLGAKVMDLPTSGPAFFNAVLPVTPPPGSDWTITAYTALAGGAYPVNDAWQNWEVRPFGGPLGQALYIWHQMPRFRYRIPGPALSPRFFVKHRDDSMRPVGFGKPATELAVFRVPGRGRWRDLTTDEYTTFGPDSRPPGGMPLKVKRLDAGGTVWWDHVGWMVPDA